MTLVGVECSSEAFIHIKDIAPIMGCNPQSIRSATQTEEGRKALGFAVTRVGTRTLIPRMAFIRFVKEGVCDVYATE